MKTNSACCGDFSVNFNDYAQIRTVCDKFPEIINIILPKNRFTDSRRYSFAFFAHIASQFSQKFGVINARQTQIQNLFAMTPYYWRTSPADAEKLRGLSELTTEVDMILSVYRKDA